MCAYVLCIEIYALDLFQSLRILLSSCVLTAVVLLILMFFLQGDALGVYVGLAQCLSEMSDSDIDGIARVAEVKYCAIVQSEG